MMAVAAAAMVGFLRRDSFWDGGGTDANAKVGQKGDPSSDDGGAGGGGNGRRSKERRFLAGGGSRKKSKKR